MVRQTELLEKLRISKPLLKKWEKLGLPRYKVDGSIFYDMDEVNNFIKSHSEKSVVLND